MDTVASEDKPRSSVHLSYEDNQKLTEMFAGVGLGDKVSLVITGKVTRLDEYGVGMHLKKIAKASEPEDEDDESDSSLDDEPVFANVDVYNEA